MTYNVIGLMSGSSLDGLDIAYLQLHEQRGQWTFELLAADCTPYSADWVEKLRLAPTLPLQEFFPLHTEYGRLVGNMVNDFIEKHSLHYTINFISSHGHTVFHNPTQQATFQLGDGAAIAATTGISVVSDLRSMDVALGGQGAPIVPIGDRLLFPDYHYWLNLGGIANITIRQGEEYTAFDICPCNQVLNRLAARASLPYDDGGNLAASGSIIPSLLEELNTQTFFTTHPPKSLSNEQALALGRLALEDHTSPLNDLLHTYTEHIALQIRKSIQPHINPLISTRLLATGGGAFNLHLIQHLRTLLSADDIEIIVPDDQTIQYKEAIVMALIGVLRWRGEENVLSSVTGAQRDSIGGVIWTI